MLVWYNQMLVSPKMFLICRLNKSIVSFWLFKKQNKTHQKTEKHNNNSSRTKRKKNKLKNPTLFFTYTFKKKKKAGHIQCYLEWKYYWNTLI